MPAVRKTGDARDVATGGLWPVSRAAQRAVMGGVPVMAQGRQSFRSRVTHSLMHLGQVIHAGD